ncbi:MAG: DUF302 domain-containing protein [Acidobacteriaceae bacterium]|nr:DUF302 domain-containing protein [Acidobacteriaceae bacterium]
MPASLSDYLAAERTLLAWIRTGLALMGFGFVLARFGLFLERVLMMTSAVTNQSYGLSLWFGTGLIVAGIVVNAFAGWHHIRLVQQLDRGDLTHSRGSLEAVAVAFFLTLAGIVMAIYLISVRSPTNSQFEKKKESFLMQQDKGFVSTSSNHSVNETVERLKQLLHAKGVTLFAVVDHSGEAEKAGMKMPPTQLLIFGNPKAGTPVMLAAPSIAIDLPLKILVWEDAQGKVWTSYNSATYLQQRHDVPQQLMQNLAGVEALASKASE